MRFSSRTWFLLSLMLFAAALWMWLFAERFSAAHSRDAAHAASAHPASPAVAPSTNASNKPHSAKPDSYRLTNTRQTVDQLARNSHALILRNALIDTALPVRMAIPKHLRSKGAPGSYIVQSDRPLDKDFYVELKRDGASYVGYIPNNAAVVQATPEQAKEMAQDPAFQAVLPYEPYYKLDSTLLPAAVEQEPETNALRVTTFPGQRDAALAALTAMGATVIGEDRSPFGPTLIVKAPPGSLAAVAQLPLAQEIEVYSPRRQLNDLTRVLLGVSTDTLSNTPNYRNLTGTNIWLNINDTGVDATHPDLAGRVFGVLTDNDGHGTHVAGTIAGSGVESKTVSNYVSGSIIPGADFRGMAPEANLYVQNVDLLLGPLVSDAYLQSNASYYLSTNAAGGTNGGALTNGFISNNSWGYQSQVYDMNAASYDAAVRDSQPAVQGEQAMLYVFAAGNNGGGSGTGLDGLEGTVTSPATAKNVITVGAIDSPRFITNEVSYDGVTTNEVFYGSTDNSNLVTFFSSCGNVGVGTEGEFGRFKPDVVAPGVFTVSCRATDYVDPTYETTVDFEDIPDQIVNPGRTNVTTILLPADVVSAIIQLVPNAQSPSQNLFSRLLIQAGVTDPPTGAESTSPTTVASGLIPLSQWYVAVINPTNQPISYDLEVYMFSTNTEGDYFTVLSNMNNALRPYYRYETGTSMAAGAVSGVLALMQQFLLTNYPGNPNPSPALLKALLINGAQSLGTPYDYDTQPPGGNEQGWGLVSLTNSLPPTLSNTLWFVDQSPANALSSGEYSTYSVNSSDTNVANYPLRVTLVWSDPPGNPAAGIALVNNLELTVLDASGTNVFVGNNFGAGNTFTQLSSPTNMAPSDVINNVQNVYIPPGPTPLKWPLKVIVNAARVNVNAVTTQTNQIAQDFALVVSSGAPALTSPVAVLTSGISTATNALVTVVNSGVALMHQRVGANEPNLYNYTTGATNGALSQWHFFVFTNNQFIGAIKATNVMFATFYPPNLSRPRNTDADIDLYASEKSGLTNLIPIVIRNAQKSLNRGGNEFIIYSNSTPNAVYYIGVKSEDQQASDFGFFAVAQEQPFSLNGLNGVTGIGTPLPMAIPDGSYDDPAYTNVLAVVPSSLPIRKVVVTNAVTHADPGDLAGTLTLFGTQTTVFLNNHTGEAPGYSYAYDDMPESPNSGTTPTDGPGTLRNYIGQQGGGIWMLTEVDNASGADGSVTAYSVTVSPSPPTYGPIVITIPGGGAWYNYVVVPNDAIYLTNVVLFTSVAGAGPVGIYMTDTNYVSPADPDGTNGIVAPGGYLLVGTNNTYNPPLTGGTWYYGIFNFGTEALTLTNYIFFDESLTPNLIQTYSNSVPVSLTTDGTTASQICMTNGVGQLVDLQVGLCVADTNLDDLSIRLVSPQGTSVLLFENRGGLLASNLGMVLTSTNSTNSFTNIIYTVFTENTNQAKTPIKFAPPPYASTNGISSTNTIITSTGFEGITNGTYTNGQAIGGSGWTVETNQVGVMNDPHNAHAGSNFLALTTGRIAQTFATVPGTTYELHYFVRSPQITDWWPADDTLADIVGANNGTVPYPGPTYDVGEVGDAFTFNEGNEIDFGTNAANFGTNDFTVDFWIKQPTDATNLYGVLEKRVTCGNLFAFLDIHSGPEEGLPTSGPGRMFIDFSGNAAAGYVVLIDTNKQVNDGVFHHAAFVRNGLTLAIYIDGFLDTNMITSGIANLTNPNTFRAGQSVCVGMDGSVPFEGDLDELDLWSRALSPAEIQAIYDAGSQGKYNTNSLLPNLQVSIDGYLTNRLILTNFTGGWQACTNSFTATNAQTTIELAGNTLSVLLDDVSLVELPSTNYNNYYLAEEPLTTFVGENPTGCWTLQLWDTRNDSLLPTNGVLLSWNLQMTISSTNVNLIVLTNGMTYTNAATNAYQNITYFAVDVPTTANFATNILTAGGAIPLNLLFNQTQLPTGQLPGDYALLAGVTQVGGPGTNTLSSQGAPPPLLPGRRYYLGMQNNGTVNEQFTLKVQFDIATNQIIPLTNSIAYTNVFTNAPQYYSFAVPSNATLVTFQVLNPTNAELDLYAREGLPVPGPFSFDYASRVADTNDQFIVVTTNSLPVPLPVPSTNAVLPPPASNIWYLAVYNPAAVTNAGYTILATYVVNGGMDVIPLANAIPYTNSQPPGFPTNLVYSFTVTSNVAGVDFFVTNTSGFGNVQLLVGDGTFPTPGSSYSGSFNAGTAVQFVQIGTNADLPSVEGTWYLAVPNTYSNAVGYTITAAVITNSAPVTNAPLVLSALLSSPAGVFSMTWNSQAGRVYSIDVSTNLTQWTLVTNITATSAETSYSDAAPMHSQIARYFRLSSP